MWMTISSPSGDTLWAPLDSAHRHTLNKWIHSLFAKLIILSWGHCAYFFSELKEDIFYHGHTMTGFNGRSWVQHKRSVSFIKTFACNKSIQSIQYHLPYLASAFNISTRTEKKWTNRRKNTFFFWNLKDIAVTMCQFGLYAQERQYISTIFRSCPFKTGKRLSPQYGFGVWNGVRNQETSLCGVCLSFPVNILVTTEQ